jgi:hypothetical protein
MTHGVDVTRPPAPPPRVRLVARPVNQGHARGLTPMFRGLGGAQPRLLAACRLTGTRRRRPYD